MSAHLHVPALAPRRRALALAWLATLLAACAPAAARGTIVLPPPPSSEPSALASAVPSAQHVHSIAVIPGGLLVGTHQGVYVARRGASPEPPRIPGGDVLQVALGAGGALFAAGHNLGVQVSRDGGRTWGAAAPEVAGLDVHGLAVDPRDPRTMFAYAVGRGILVSVDGGGHWTHRPGDADPGAATPGPSPAASGAGSPAPLYLTGLAVTADGTLLAGSPQLGVAASTRSAGGGDDRGVRFVSVYQGPGKVYALAASAADANVVFVAGEAGIFITQDGGAHWSSGTTSDTVTGVGIDPADPNHLFAGGVDGALFESTDGGSSWKLYPG